MSLQIFLRKRGLFVKFLLTYLVVCGAVIAIVGAIDVGLSGDRFKREVRSLFAGIDRGFFETTTHGVDVTDPVACRDMADAVFWRIVERGTSQVSDFAAMLSYFANGQLHVAFASSGRVLCASSPEASPLLAKTLSSALESRTSETLLRDGRDWAVVERFEPGGAIPQIFIGVQYLPEWTTGPTLPYDLLRTVVLVSVLGIGFGTVWMWLLARTIQMEKRLSVSMERQRIARDLHDTAKQRSFVLGLKLTELEHDARGQEALLQIVGEARRLADHLQQDLLDAVSGFNLPVVSELGLREALTRNVEDLLVGSSIEWTLDLAAEVEATLQRVPMAAQELLMITHEAVANALRHSGCHWIRVTCQAVTAAGAAARWSWIVEDDGTGFDPRHAPAGMGLANLRWRASALPDGVLSIQSGSTGSRIEVTFTLQTREVE